MLYPVGLAGGDVAFAEDKPITGHDTQFYGSIWVKVSNSFVGNGSG
jgi:hypothetical protein